MREYRNRISYEGFFVEKEYIETRSKKIKQIINILMESIEKRLV